jgi:hypothetical protein
MGAALESTALSILLTCGKDLLCNAQYDSHAQGMEAASYCINTEQQAQLCLMMTTEWSLMVKA